MSKRKRNVKSGPSRANLYDDITNEIIADLETGCVAWVQPWRATAAKAPLAMPQNVTARRHFTIFNTDQCDGLPVNISTVAPVPPPQMISPQVEALIRATGIDFRIGGNRAFYSPCEDYIQVPPPVAYFEPINWHRTALHELAHASGHPSRLNRDLSGGYGTKEYAFEEIVAEISAAFCCASLGIEPTVRHADYIGSWLRLLRENNRAIVQAALQASSVADYLLGFLPELTGADAFKDELPPITAILDWSQARLIDLRNALFTKFERLLVARIEGAIVSRACDVGLDALRAIKRIGERELA
jgi:antirestriction protein ArdC